MQLQRPPTKVFNLGWAPIFYPPNPIPMGEWGSPQGPHPVVPHLCSYERRARWLLPPLRHKVRSPARWPPSYPSTRQSCPSWPPSCPLMLASSLPSGGQSSHRQVTGQALVVWPCERDCEPAWDLWRRTNRIWSQQHEQPRRRSTPAQAAGLPLPPCRLGSFPWISLPCVWRIGRERFHPMTSGLTSLSAHMDLGAFV
jgi:hypothetical protein